MFPSFPAQGGLNDKQKLEIKNGKVRKFIEEKTSNGMAPDKDSSIT